MLVSALAGREHVLAAYETAVEEKYQFLQFWRCNVYCRPEVLKLLVIAKNLLYNYFKYFMKEK